MPDVASTEAKELTPQGVRLRGAAPVAPPTVILRPQLWMRAAGPVLIVLALYGFYVGSRRISVVVLLAGLACLPALFVKIQVDEYSVRRRGVRGWERPVALDSVTELGLRRSPWRAFKWWPKGYRLGRFYSLPLRLRLLEGTNIRFQLTVVFWRDWGTLARFMAARPDVHADGRTRGRLERYA